jgi:hypothetical protein
MNCEILTIRTNNKTSPDKSFLFYPGTYFLKACFRTKLFSIFLNGYAKVDSSIQIRFSAAAIHSLIRAAVPSSPKSPASYSNSLNCPSRYLLFSKTIRHLLSVKNDRHFTPFSGFSGNRKGMQRLPAHH